MSHLLYHCFVRSKKNEIEPAIDVLEGIIREGLFLIREDPVMRWRDPCGGRRYLQVRQYRLCLTSLNNDVDLRKHCEIFGPIGIGFKTKFIRNLGGFPVFYLPAPVGNNEKDSEDWLGVSLVYRIAELRNVMEMVRRLPVKYQRQIYSYVQDVEELEGAVRFLGNILYFTDYTRQKDTLSLQYYRQREWRIIAGSTSDHVRVETYGNSPYYILSDYKMNPIHKFIKDVVVYGTKEDSNRVDDVLRNHGISIRSRLLG